MRAANNSTHGEGIADAAANVRFSVIVSLYVPMFLISEIRNGFIIYSLGYLRRRRRTAVDCYILNLAVADILVTTLSLFTAVEYVNNEWTLGETICKLHGLLLESCYAVSALTLLVISYNRTKVVKNSFKIHNAKKTIRRNIASIWTAAFMLISPVLYAYTVAKRNGRYHCSITNFDKMTRQIYYLLQAVILFFIPFLVMIMSHRQITKGLREHSGICQTMITSTTFRLIQVVANERRIGKSLTCIWIVFVCCFFPSITFRTIDHFTSIRKRSEIWNQIWHACLVLVLLNSSINPFLYYRATNRDPSKVGGIARLLCCTARQKRKRDVLDCHKLRARPHGCSKVGNIGSQV